MKENVQRIERIALALVAVATLVSLLTWDARVVLGVGLGGALGAVNFHALRRIMAAIFAAEGARNTKLAFCGVLLSFKFGALAAVLFAVVNYTTVDPLAFIIGISVVVLSIFIEGFRIMLQSPAAQSE